MRIQLTVNGERKETEVWEGESLLFALRERLGLPGSKNACEQGECGSCSVLLDGTLVCACLVLAGQADGHHVVTVEGLAQDGHLHRVHAGHGHRLRDVDTEDAGVRVRAAHRPPPEHPRRVEVARVRELAGDLGDGVAPLPRRHRAAALEHGPRRHEAAAASLTASRILA